MKKAPGRGDIVAFWPDGSEPFRIGRDRGYILPGVYNKTDCYGYSLMLKRLMGLPGDIVSITDDGVIVNGNLLPNTVPLTHDNVGDPLPGMRITDYRLAERGAFRL